VLVLYSSAVATPHPIHSSFNPSFDSVARYKIFGSELSLVFGKIKASLGIVLKVFQTKDKETVLKGRNNRSLK
jgi:hypothetical protein